MMRPVEVRRSATFAVTPGATSMISLITTEDCTRSRKVVAKRASGSDAWCRRSGSSFATQLIVIVSASLSQLALSTASQSLSRSIPSRLITSSVVAVATTQRPSFSSAPARAFICLEDSGAVGSASITQSGIATDRRLAMSLRYDFSSALDSRVTLRRCYWLFAQNYGRMGCACRRLGVMRVPCIEGVGEDEPQTKGTEAPCQAH